MPKILPQTTSAATEIISVNPAGKALMNTFVKKCPLIRSFVGSSASKKPGTPIVNPVTREICEGSRGYVNIKTAEKTAISSEKIFLTKNRLADRWMLLTTCLPSSTTFGMCTKSESSRTTCATCAVASLPDAIATLQSASFIAKISLTPSPVIATVCPFFCKADTKACFCFGVTRPKTVFVSSASSTCASVVKVEAST